MAAGINQSEKFGKDAVTADVVAAEPFPLPNNAAAIQFQHETKSDSLKI